jgi:phenylpropionate dioxygenase-like ring-hydroxylating dioxygenase large terminal subunit
MTVTPQKPENIESPSQPGSQFNWKNCWYPVTFIQDFPSDRPYSFSIYDQPLVLFKDQTGQIICLQDRCPHRAAKLSAGQIIDGKIECLYHGWQFGNQGNCLHIPHLPDTAKIPKTACIRSFEVVEHQGMIWVWLGDSEKADSQQIPTIPDLEQPGLFRVDTVTDLPFDQTYLVENFLDPAHVCISHDRTEYKIKREDAQPLEMEVLSVSIEGFKGRYRKLSNSQIPWNNVEFIAPYLVTYSFGPITAFALYAVPLAPGRSRILARRLGNFYDRMFKLKPRWLEHLRQNKVFEEDLSFIQAQEAYINQSGKTIKDTYFPLKTSDVLLIEHRKWLDQFGVNLPHYQGYSTHQHLQHSTAVNLNSRFLRHTQICSSCNRAYQTTQKVQQISIAVAIALAAIGIISEGNLSVLTVSTALLAVIIAILAHKLKTHFEM